MLLEPDLEFSGLCSSFSSYKEESLGSVKQLLMVKTQFALEKVSAKCEKNKKVGTNKFLLKEAVSFGGIESKTC